MPGDAAHYLGANGTCAAIVLTTSCQGVRPNGLALSDHVQAEQVELDFPDDARYTDLGPVWHARTTDTDRTDPQPPEPVPRLHPDSDITITPAA